MTQKMSSKICIRDITESGKCHQSLPPPQMSIILGYIIEISPHITYISEKSR